MSKEIKKVKPMTVKRANKLIRNLTGKAVIEKMPERIEVIKTKINVLENFILFNGGK